MLTSDFAGPLDEKLAGIRAKSATAMEPARLAATDDLIASLEREVVQGALAVGEVAPDFVLRQAIDDVEVRLSDQLTSGPAILSFYRGQWCPYCNFELQAMQRRKDEFDALSATMFFIGPESRDNSMKMIEKSNAIVPVLYDLDGAVMDAFRISFTLPESLRRNRDSWNPNTGWKLPIPATYVIGRDGRVAARFLNADYRYRAEPEAILQAVRDLA